MIIKVIQFIFQVTFHQSQSTNITNLCFLLPVLCYRSRLSEVETKDDEEDDSEVESSDESWNSEDDPDRLWCICKKPHNNRFMICCDSCEDWFHGKCVGVTKSMGMLPVLFSKYSCFIWFCL
jgi:hypothetical protein